jgi:hypothetical protein
MNISGKSERFGIQRSKCRTSVRDHLPAERGDNRRRQWGRTREAKIHRHVLGSE